MEIIHENNQNTYVKFSALKGVFRYSFESFASILSIPSQGQCSYSEDSSLDSLRMNLNSFPPFKTNIPTPKAIIQSLTISGQTIFPNKILKEELRVELRSWNEIIQENAFGTQNNSPFLLASSCHMMYCILTSTPFNFTSTKGEEIKLTDCVAFEGNTIFKGSKVCPSLSANARAAVKVFVSEEQN
ncbi:hypothetical protein Tco_0477639 [Tanacetum coccineum]